MEPATILRSAGSGYSLPGISEGLFTGVVEGDHLDLRHSHQECFLNQKPFTQLTFQENQNAFSCLLGLDRMYTSLRLNKPYIYALKV